MALVFRNVLQSPLSTIPYRSSARVPITACSTASVHMDGYRKFIEFPYVSTFHRELMVDLVSTVENRLQSELRPCELSPEVQYYENESGTAHGSLHIRSGNKSSPVDFMLGSWVHCNLPTGGQLNITSLSTYLKASTDAPNFLFELIQGTPTTLVLILDLPPRKDLILHPDYLTTFYEDTQLDTHRQMLEKLPEFAPYISSSLYIRSLISPTALTFRVEVEAGKPERLEEIIKTYVHPIAKEVLGIWVDKCTFRERKVADTESAVLEKRDKLIKRKIIEIDIGSNFPRLFGQDIAARVVAAIENVFAV